MKTGEFCAVFDRSIDDYHKTDNVDAVCVNPYDKGSLEHLLYEKNWIDAVQWHLEDLIRNPSIEPAEALEIKRRIDRLNQERTDIVEHLDSCFMDRYKDIKHRPDAGINTETPAWAIDRLSILALKIWHMRVETLRKDASREHVGKCSSRLSVLLQQKEDLIRAIDELFRDLESGAKYMKVYRQMKMYNDADTNPVLYSSVGK